MANPTFPSVRLPHWLMALLLLLSHNASAQLLVYHMEFEREAGFNDVPFTGAYFIAPIEGGDASFVFTAGKGSGRSVVEAHSTGRFFRAVTDNREVRWVAQAQVGSGGGTPTTPTNPGDDDDDNPPITTPPTGSADLGQGGVPGTSTGAFLAVGKASLNAALKTPFLIYETKIATKLEGRNVSGSSQVADETRRKYGYVTFNKWKLNWSSRWTQEVNARDLNLNEATVLLANTLRTSPGGGEPPIPIPALAWVTAPDLGIRTVNNAAISIPLQATGGTGNYTFSLAAGSVLPPGLLLSGSTLTAAANALNTTGEFTFTLNVASAGTSQSVGQQFTLIVNPVIIPLSPQNFTATEGQPFEQQFTFAGGVANPTWVNTSILPDGLTFSITGLLSGTPTTAAPASAFQIQFGGLRSDGSPFVIEGDYTITINAP